MIILGLFVTLSAIWTHIEGRLLPMLEGEENLTLALHENPSREANIIRIMIAESN